MANKMVCVIKIFVRGTTRFYRETVRCMANKMVCVVMISHPLQVGLYHWGKVLLSKDLNEKLSGARQIR